MGRYYEKVHEITVVPTLHWVPRKGNKDGEYAHGGGFGFYCYTLRTPEGVQWEIMDLKYAVKASGVAEDDDGARTACNHAALDHFGMSYDLFSSIVTRFK